MTRRAAVALRCAVLLLLVAGPARSEPAWPSTDLAGHARAWFAHLAAPESEARSFYAAHFAASALEQVPIDARLERRRGLLERTGGLTALEVLDSSPVRLRVRARDGSGEEPTVTFEGEAAPPHRVLSIRIELGGPDDGPPPVTGPSLADAEAVRQIREFLDAKAATGEFSGAVLVARGATPLLREAWGVADRANGAAITTSTRFNIASLGKLLTRTAHRSGVGDICNERYAAMDHAKLRHTRDYLQLIRDQPLWFDPGTSSRYSNGGYVLLGEVIAKASGMDYYDYLASHVFTPAGMKATSAPIEGDGTPGLARGYTRQGVKAGEERDNVVTRPARGSAAGGLYSTIDDYFAFDQALMCGKLCSPEWASWVCEGPRRAGVAPGFGFAGGAPGVATEWTHEGDRVLILFTNRDPEVTRAVVRPVRDLLMRMAP